MSGIPKGVPTSSSQSIQKYRHCLRTEPAYCASPQSQSFAVLTRCPPSRLNAPGRRWTKAGRLRKKVLCVALGRPLMNHPGDHLEDRTPLLGSREAAACACRMGALTSTAGRQTSGVVSRRAPPLASQRDGRNEASARASFPYLFHTANENGTRRCRKSLI
jgi:hypothetical protein